MRNARDPALFLSIYLDKHTANPDPRRAVLGEIDKFVKKYHLKADVAPRQFAAEIDLASVHRSPPDYCLLFRAQTELRRPPSGTFYQCLAYVYADAIVIQFAISQFSDWVGSLTAGWNELLAELRAGFDGMVLDAAQEMTLGVSAVYWTIADAPKHIEEYRSEVSVLAEDHQLARTPTDLGPLWHCDRPVFSGVETVSQDLWMLVTPRTAEPEVNIRYHRPSVSSPPDFSVVALANHKIGFEWQQYRIMRTKLSRLDRVLNHRAHQLLEVQARLGPKLDELRSEKGIDFQRKLSRAGLSLASYTGQVLQVKSLHRSLIINRRNYLINSIALISSGGAAKVIRARDQEKAAANFLDRSEDDEIFTTSLGQTQGKCSQLASDLSYDDFLIARYSGYLRAAADQLQIAGQRELGEIGHHISVDSAAVVASVAAILVVEEVVNKYENNQYLGSGLLLALWVVIGAFALTQALSSGWRGKLLEQVSVSLTFAMLGAWLASVGLKVFDRQLRVLPNLSFLAKIDWHWYDRTFAAAAIGFSLGWLLHRYLSRRSGRKRLVI